MLRLFSIAKLKQLRRFSNNYIRKFAAFPQRNLIGISQRVFI